MTEIQTLTAWLHARLELAKRDHDEGGFSAIEWLFIALGVLAIAGIAVAAVTAYVNRQASQLNG